MNEAGPQVIEFLYGTDNYLFKNINQVTNSELETFIMACWRCFMTNTQWLLLFYKNEQLVPYWQIAFTVRLLIETVADLKYVLSNKGRAVNALNAYKNFPTLTDEDFIIELRKLRGSRKEKEESLLNCNIGKGNITRIEDMLGSGYADIYALLCNYCHCNYCGILVATNPTKQLTKLRSSSADFVLKLCKAMQNTLSEYKKFNGLPDWLNVLSKYKSSKSIATVGKEKDEK